MITLNPLFRDGAVFQQRMPIPVWGKATPGNMLKAEFAGKETFTKAAAAGNFMFRLPAENAGGPFELKITDVSNGENITVNDILVGEVWLASGQSNMEYAIGSDWVQSPEEDAHGPHCVNRIQETEYCNTIQEPVTIRFINVDKKASGLEEETFFGEWKPMDPENAPFASAVSAWFSRFVQEKINVPIGLVIAPWGGTIAEAWTSRAGLLSNPETAPMVYDTDQVYSHEETWTRNPNVPDTTEVGEDPGNKGVEWGWAKPEFDDSDWGQMKVPGSWIVQKISGNGALWVRTAVDIPEAWAGKDLEIHLGGIDKQDVTYFNGVEVGGMGKGLDTTYWNKPRLYTIPANLVKPGKNILAVRAYSFMYDGSFQGTRKNYYIHPAGDAGSPIFFSGVWQVKAELDLGVLRPAGVTLPPGPGNHNTPGILFNGMIRPLIPYAIRGVIWYQGESNAHTVPDSLTYEKKICTLIRDWRYQWGQGDFPFIQVQLANFSPDLDPEFVPESRWAILRDAQRKACLNLPGVSMCTAVDAGDLKDIHPQDKKTVGIRMAANALHHVYGMRNIVPFGPLYQSHRVEGNKIRIEFQYAEGMTLRKDLPQSFYIAGKDRFFLPATSVEIEGSSILISNEKITSPYAVRYGWTDAVISTLYNAAGLPASPFRTDDWDFFG